PEREHHAARLVGRRRQPLCRREIGGPPPPQGFSNAARETAVLPPALGVFRRVPCGGIGGFPPPGVTQFLHHDVDVVCFRRSFFHLDIGIPRPPRGRRTRN